MASAPGPDGLSGALPITPAPARLLNKTWAARPTPRRPEWRYVYDRDGKLRALAERRTSWWCLYWASDDEPAAHGCPHRHETLRAEAEAYTGPDYGY